MAAGKDERISVDLTQIVQYPIGSGGDLEEFRRRGSHRGTDSVRPLFMDLYGAKPLVFAEIPFD